VFGEYGFKNLHRNTREKSKLNLNSLKINQQNVQLVLLHSNIKLNVECQRLQPTRSLVNKKQKGNELEQLQQKNMKFLSEINPK